MMKDFFKIRTPLSEEHGAGEQGTPSLVAKYKNATPGQSGSGPTGQQPARKGDKLNAKFEPVKEATELDEAIEVAHDRYMRSHGKKASGTGQWMFTHKRMGGVDYKNDKEVHSASGKFSDAAKSAKAWAKQHGHSTVYVMEDKFFAKESIDEGYKEQDDMYRKEAVKHAERVMKAVGSPYMSGCKYHARALQDMADEMENTIEYRKNDEKRMKAMKANGVY